jgi:hypothetical protein
VRAARRVAVHRRGPPGRGATPACGPARHRARIALSSSRDSLPNKPGLVKSIVSVIGAFTRLNLPSLNNSHIRSFSSQERGRRAAARGRAGAGAAPACRRRRPRARAGLDPTAAPRPVVGLAARPGVRLGWAEFVEGAEVLYLYDRGDGGFGYAVDPTAPGCSEWGCAPFPAGD